MRRADRTFHKTVALKERLRGNRAVFGSQIAAEVVEHSLTAQQQVHSLFQLRA